MVRRDGGQGVRYFWRLARTLLRHEATHYWSLAGNAPRWSGGSIIGYTVTFIYRALQRGSPDCGECGPRDRVQLY